MLVGISASAILLVTSAIPVFAKVERESGPWELTAPKAITFTCGGSWYHTLSTINNLADGDFQGTGVWNGSPAYTWNIDGNIDGDSITFHLVYSGGNPGYTLNGTGSIASDGSINGSTDGNCTAFSMPSGSAIADEFESNHGQYVRSQENKQEAAHSRIGMPVQSKGHTK